MEHKVCSAFLYGNASHSVVLKVNKRLGKRNLI